MFLPDDVVCTNEIRLGVRIGLIVVEGVSVAVRLNITPVSLLKICQNYKSFV